MAPQTATEPFKPGRNISGFRTGPLGMGHVVMHCRAHRRGDAVLRGRARSSSSATICCGRSRRYFFHVNPRHHSLALVETGKNCVHHMMMELLQPRRCRPGLRPRAGRPGADRGDARPPLRRLRDVVLHLESRPASWSSTAGAGRWSTTTPGSRSSARMARACGATTARGCRPRSGRSRASSASKAAEDGLRQPVQVIEGNSTRCRASVPGGTA